MLGTALADAVNDVIGQVTGLVHQPEQAWLHLRGLLADRRPPPLPAVDRVTADHSLLTMYTSRTTGVAGGATLVT